MPQASAIVINDGQATPVAKTFSPEGPISGGMSFVERTAGLFAGFWRLSVTLKQSKTVSRAAYWLAIPKVEVVNGVNVVTRVARAKSEFIYDQLATTAERNDLYALHSNAGANTTVRTVCRDLEALW